MGEARDIVEGESVKRGSADPDSALGMLEALMDDLDRALEIKQHDFFAEGQSMKPENGFKCGVLQASLSLLRRAKALLEDYAEPLPPIESNKPVDVKPESDGPSKPKARKKSKTRAQIEDKVFGKPPTAKTEVKAAKTKVKEPPSHESRLKSLKSRLGKNRKSKG